MALPTTELTDTATPASREALDAPTTSGAGSDLGAGGSTEHPLFVRAPAMAEAARVAGQALATDRLVCLVGEGSTGREALARDAHARQSGLPEHFVRFDCTLLQASALDERLAHHGTSRSAVTFYLAHLTALSLEGQARLARYIRHGVPGHVAETPVRWLASLDVAPAAATEDGDLLPDLQDLLVTVNVPALRERRVDIPLLAEHHLALCARRRGKPARTFSRPAASLLSALPWPGNGTEVVALMETLASAVDRQVVELDDVLAHVRLATYAERPDAGVTLRKAREQFERDCISAALVRHRGRMAEAAQALGIQRTNLYRKMRQLKVPRAGKPTRG